MGALSLAIVRTAERRRYGFLLRVPLLCSRYGQGQAESVGEVFRGFIKGQAMDSGPKVQDIAVSAARRMEALEHLLAEMDGEGPLAGRTAGGMERTRTATLRARPFEFAQAAQMGQDLLHANLSPQGGKIDTTGSSGDSWFGGFGVARSCLPSHPGLRWELPQ